MNLARGLLLKPTLNLLNRLLRREGGNSLIIGGPLGWSWQATLDEAHHGSLSGPTDAHRHSDLAGIGPDDHHDRMHDHSQAGDGSPIALAGLPDLALGKVWLGNASNRPAEADPGGIPSGLIAMWGGLLADIPSGWVLCDGNNSTPNLLARFIRGVPTGATNPGATGGSDSVSLSVSQLASHSHTYLKWTKGNNAPTTGRTRAEYYSDQATGTAGSNSAHENRPAYYELAFIMKT